MALTSNCDVLLILLLVTCDTVNLTVFLEGLLASTMALCAAVFLGLQLFSVAPSLIRGALQVSVLGLLLSSCSDRGLLTPMPSDAAPPGPDLQCGLPSHTPCSSFPVGPPV